MRKTLKIAVAASALTAGLWAAPTLYAQQTTQEPAPQGDMMQGQGGMMQAQGDMGQDMMGMMNMMQQMSRMMGACAKMMEGMAQQMPPAAPQEQAPKQDG